MQSPQTYLELPILPKALHSRKHFQNKYIKSVSVDGNLVLVLLVSFSLERPIEYFWYLIHLGTHRSVRVGKPGTLDSFLFSESHSRRLFRCAAEHDSVTIELLEADRDLKLSKLQVMYRCPVEPTSGPLPIAARTVDRGFAVTKVESNCMFGWNWSKQIQTFVVRPAAAARPAKVCPKALSLDSKVQISELCFASAMLLFVDKTRSGRLQLRKYNYSANKLSSWRIPKTRSNGLLTNGRSVIYLTRSGQLGLVSSSSFKHSAVASTGMASSHRDCKVESGTLYLRTFTQIRKFDIASGVPVPVGSVCVADAHLYMQGLSLQKVYSTLKIKRQPSLESLFESNRSFHERCALTGGKHGDGDGDGLRISLTWSATVDDVCLISKLFDADSRTLYLLLIVCDDCEPDPEEPDQMTFDLDVVDGRTRVKSAITLQRFLASTDRKSELGTRSTKYLMLAIGLRTKALEYKIMSSRLSIDGLAQVHRNRLYLTFSSTLERASEIERAVESLNSNPRLQNLCTRTTRKLAGMFSIDSRLTSLPREPGCTLRHDVDDEIDLKGIA